MVKEGDKVIPKPEEWIKSPESKGPPVSLQCRRIQLSYSSARTNHRSLAQSG
jgi:hypothetical protein